MVCQYRSCYCNMSMVCQYINGMLTLFFLYYSDYYWYCMSILKMNGDIE